MDIRERSVDATRGARGARRLGPATVPSWATSRRSRASGGAPEPRKARWRACSVDVLKHRLHPSISIPDRVSRMRFRFLSLGGSRLSAQDTNIKNNAPPTQTDEPATAKIAFAGAPVRFGRRPASRSGRTRPIGPRPARRSTKKTGRPKSTASRLRHRRCRRLRSLPARQKTSRRPRPRARSAALHARMADHACGAKAPRATGS